jgi:hypothetical protein
MSLTATETGAVRRRSVSAHLRSRVSASRAPWWARVGVVLAPFIGVAFLRAPLINQIGYIDPWFDDGYAWSLAHGLRLFEDPYYGVRFPPILLIAGATDLFGAVAGYLILHYLILLGTGAVLYRCVRRFASSRVALCAVLLLMLDVYFLRLELWDYASFVQIPAMLCAVAVWPRGNERWQLGVAAVAGALVSAAAFSQQLSLLVVPPVLIVECVAAARLRDGEFIRIAARLAMAALGGVALFFLGWFIYWLAVGFSPHDMISPTINYIEHGNSGAYSRPIRSWIFDEPKVYGPVLAVVALMLIARRRLLGTDLAARLGQFSVVFVAELWLYRLVDGSSAIVESWWAYDVTAISVAFSAAIILDELDRLPRRRTIAIALAVAAAALADLVIRLLGVHAEDIYNHLRNHYWRELVLVVVGLGPLLFWSRLGPMARALAVALVLVVITGFSLAPADYLGIQLAIGRTGEFGNLPLDELRTYSIGPMIARDTAAHDSPASRTLMWDLQQGDVLASMWGALPSLGGSMNNYLEPTGLPLDSFERSRLAFPTTARLFVVGQVPGDLATARGDLRAAGYHFTAGRPGTWLGGLVQHQLLQLRALPAGDAQQAVRVMVGSIRRAWRNGDTQDLCWWTYPTLETTVDARGAGSCKVGMRNVLRGKRPPSGAIQSIHNVAGGDISVKIAGLAYPWVFSRAGGEWLLVSGAPWLP